MSHYVGMAGLHGCLPQCCDAYDTYQDAVESMAQIHNLGKNRKRELKKYGYLELNIRRDGNEYIEIQRHLGCSCDCQDCGYEYS